jgi:acetyltransferase-like isoleucine patch superfamily enzyme
VKHLLPDRIKAKLVVVEGRLRRLPQDELFGPGFAAHHVTPPPRAYARYGTNSWIIPPSTIVGAERIHVGDNVTVMEGADLVTYGDGEIHLRDGVHLTRFVSIIATCSVTVGRAVLTSDNVSITDSFGPRPLEHPTAVAPPPAAPVVIEDGAYLGANCIIGPGVTVGAGAFVGEGACVYEDVPPHSVFYGNPAQMTRHHDPASNRWIGARHP